MGLLIDIHVHTRRYSPCSRIDPGRLVEQAIRCGLDGVVITEHHRQWSRPELDELLEKADAPGFLLLSGFEYASDRGDILVYGLEPESVGRFQPGWSPERAVKTARDLGGVCVAAHPTRMGMGFDERLLTLPFDAVEVASVNLRLHEQRLASQLAEKGNLRPVAASDAHELADVGRFATLFHDPLRSMPGLQEAFRHGRFEISRTRFPVKVRKR